MKFENYHISSDIKENLASLGFKRPTDIQFKAIPSIMKGEDVMAIAQTGTGKTAAFAIPLIDRIHDQKNSKRSAGIKCIVMVPTRELAAQIGEVFDALSKHTKVKTFVVYGGIEQDPQIKKLAQGIDVLVATPGRMFDLISQGAISLKDVDTLVLDEADQMLDLGFIKDIEAVKRKLTKKHQTLFFSATINREIKKLAFSQVSSSAIRIQISPDDPVSKNVSHYVMFVEMDDKRFFLRRFVLDHPDDKIIVFVRTRVRAERVAKALARADIAAQTLHGEKDQKDRTQVMEKFKAGDQRILIATDVSARGIDIPDVAFVINYDLPEKKENYVHRVGRTGRGINKGSAISYCSVEEKNQLEQIQGFLNKDIEMIPVSKKDYATTLSYVSGKESIQDLINEQEAWEKKNKKKNKK
ncbi:MAG: DEAD/DEAH box helicase [Proteobacteria bacterium]|nr:DEAD/DEAH box helicase [Pseudomonadota bacterium]MBU1390081.1 DEAD/DEAH box helicase [Pseudomonadota bacterium]MBU1544968.1 DEAD/DEAH box helicase [Pseudomonadota bacterium]MBU2429831.1 DEAD/DEAH box helicase [Pseudomonadota bacterium]MBU2482671.1 DEAD/DEAH box helicase [Pseudomonadota bacterium]